LEEALIRKHTWGRSLKCPVPIKQVLIGGHEDKDDDCTILKEVVRHVHNGRLVIATVASETPEEYFKEYHRIFTYLGIKEIMQLYIAERAECADEEKLRVFDNIDGVFFSGGDQLRISSQIGDTEFETRMHEIYKNGGVIAGTSAGASVLGEIMLLSGPNSESHHIGDLHLAPGLRLIHNVIIDQHFAERGRIGRLLGAVAMNPRILGIGIDENTAIVVSGREFEVIGKGAVYVIDASGITYSNINKEEGKEEGQILSLADVKLHLLCPGDQFDLESRRPMAAEGERKSQDLHNLEPHPKIPKKS
jgi:cyanophycinase